jgi:hypothetical protein
VEAGLEEMVDIYLAKEVRYLRLHQWLILEVEVVGGLMMVGMLEMHMFLLRAQQALWCSDT